ncbi:glycerophosphodiester phosphodiesterase family protein [Kocuria sp. ZOR0020]|uniref:glycerophosphodiester phosphodiesterase family protein n=1 Tax=Kocuria sp. ZOR0020 TaxID=1339234 RepID=UPI000AE150CD|nr:glycerophosphodiester phosphodiesterase family protein [Kocuria sp. ZOR0020]
MEKPPAQPPFDLQSHRGGRGQWTESSLYAFARSLELGVTTLELDTHLTQDGVVLVWHDHTVETAKCQDTAPATPNDPDFPYVGDRVRDLTYAQIQTLDCGYQQLPGYPQQMVVERNRIATLEQLFELVRDHRADGVRFNIETKVEDPSNAAERDALVDAVLEQIYTNGWPERTQLQSFDWAALDRAAPVAPELELVALAEAENPGGAGLTPQEVADRGYDVWSPQHVVLTQANIAQAHDLGLKVVPWTVNDPADMARLMDWGVDGLITDYPWQLRQLMQQRGMPLPAAYAAQDQPSDPQARPGRSGTAPGKARPAESPASTGGPDSPGREHGHSQGRGPEHKQGPKQGQHGAGTPGRN